MNEEQIKSKIEEVEKQLANVVISMLNFEYYDKLLDIRHKLTDFLYFKVNQEENFLKK